MISTTTKRAHLLAVLDKTMNIQCNEAVIQLLDENSVFIDFKKGSIVLRQGELSSNLYMITRGIVRGCYFDENGEEITKSFAKENEFFATKGLLKDQASLFQVECLEDMEAIMIPYKVIRRILEDNNNIFVAFNQYVLKAMEELEIRTRNLLMKSAGERYKVFLEQYPDLEQRINLNYIASYIGIKSGSLSRIRKQIKSEN